MIIEVPDENSIIKWKNGDKDEWKSAEISDLIKVYEGLQGDLISRSALKEEINKKKVVGRFNTLVLIDNMPSVEQEVYMHGEDYDFFIRGYKEGRKAFERPKGEWIQATDEDGIEIYRKILCSRCNKASVERFPFCHWCGADMRKGGKE